MTHRSKNKLAWLAILFLALIVVSKFGKPAGTSSATAAVNSWAIDICAKYDAQAILDSWRFAIDKIDRDTAAGVATVYVWTNRWRAAGRDGKISIGLAAYCSVAKPDGEGYAVIRGDLDEKLASVSNGNYFD